MDKKISELDELLSPEFSDELAIVDNESDPIQTKKVKLENLFSPLFELEFDEYGELTGIDPKAPIEGLTFDWGDITGTLSDQTDLQNALDGKVNISGDTMTGRLRAVMTGFQVPVIGVRETGNTEDRFWIDNWGILNWGDGSSGTPGVRAYRPFGDVLEIDGALSMLGSAVFAVDSGAVGFAFFGNGDLKMEMQYQVDNNEFYIDMIDTGDVRDQLYRAFVGDGTTRFIQFWGFENATGSVQVGGEFDIIGARLAVIQDNASRAIPTLFLAQEDVSEELIEFASTEGAGNAIQDYSALTLTPEELIKITVNGATRYLVSYSGA